MWLAVWPGVVTASMVQPSPSTTSPSLSATSGTKVAVGAGIERIVLADMQRPRGAVRAFGIDGGAGRRLDRRHRRRMIAMGVGDENMRHGLAAHGVEQRGDMRGIVGAGIDDGDLAAADDVADRALEGERPRIVGHHPAHAGHRLVDRVGREIERSCRRECRRPWPPVMRGLDSRIPLRIAQCLSGDMAGTGLCSGQP